MFGSSARIVNTTALHQVNQTTIFDVLRAEEPLSSAELARRFDVPIGTITRVASSLIKAGLISSSVQRENRQVGKPPRLLDVNDRFASVIGIELGYAATRLIATDFKGRVFESQVLPTAELVPRLRPNLKQAVLQFRDRALAVDGAPPLAGAAAGISGSVSADTGEVTHGFLPRGMPLQSLLEDWLEVPVAVDNDANLTVLAEQNFGEGRGLDHITCVLDRGWVGAGFVINGQVYRGSRNRAGELSADPVKAAGRGGEGPAPFTESFGLEHRMRMRRYHAVYPRRYVVRADMIEDLRDRAEQGDEAAQSLLDGEARAFAQAFGRLTLLLDPQALVLSGDFSAAGPHWETVMRDHFFRHYGARIAHRGETRPTIAFSRLGQDCVTLGGALSMIRRLVAAAISGGNGKGR